MDSCLTLRRWSKACQQPQSLNEWNSRREVLTSLLLHHYNREIQGNTLLKTSSSPFPKLFAQDSWHRQPRSPPGFPWQGLAMAVSSRMLQIFFLKWTRKTQREMYVCITHSPQTSKLIGVNEVTSCLFYWNEGRSTRYCNCALIVWSEGMPMLLPNMTTITQMFAFAGDRHKEKRKLCSVSCTNTQSEEKVF